MTDEPTELEPEETVDGLPVLIDVRPVEPAPGLQLPAARAAAAAATGFLAGAATLALIRHYAARRLERSTPRGPADMLPVIKTRSFLVDVHLIGRPAE